MKIPDQHASLPTGAGHVKKILIAVTWKRSIEYIPLDLSAPSVSGTIETVETWKDGSGEVVYEVTCSDQGVSATGRRLLTLRYDASLGNNSILANADSSLEWGETRITLEPDLSSATARFTNQDGVEIEGPCEVRNASLFQELSRGVVTVLLRPGQAALRRELLQRFKRCAISNETCEAALEVAHIIRHADRGAAQAGNALLLRADLHKLFDAGLLDITADGVINLDALPESSTYREQAKTWNSTLENPLLSYVGEALRRRSETDASA